MNGYSGVGLAMAGLVAFLCFSPLFVGAASAESSRDDWKGDFERPLITGPYTELLDELAKSFPNEIWNSKSFEFNGDRRIALQCLKDSSSPFAQGVLQYMKINASLGAVQKVIEDVGNYSAIFNGYDHIEVLEKRGDRWLTSWEQHVPFPFSNVRFRMMYTMRDSGRNKIYRYQLSHGNDVKYSDGLIAVTEDTNNPGKTRYFEIDFWDIRTGLGDRLVKDRIRQEGVEGVYLSDYAIQLRAERTQLGLPEIKKLASESRDKDAIAECLRNETVFKKFWPDNQP